MASRPAGGLLDALLRCQGSTVPMTSVRLNKFMKCRKRWVKLDSQAALVCKHSYEFFDDADDIEVTDAGIYFFHHVIIKEFVMKTKY